jgi:hypothetical protein
MLSSPFPKSTIAMAVAVALGSSLETHTMKKEHRPLSVMHRNVV